MALLPKIMTEDERDGISHALATLARYKYFERMGTEIAYEYYNAVEGDSNDAAVTRKIRDAHAVKQHFMMMQSEASTLGQSLDSESTGDLDE